MRARVSASSLRKLDKVESLLFDDDGQSRGGVLLVPAIMSLDAWERVAMASQERLAREAHEDIDRGGPNVLDYVGAQADPTAPMFHTADPHRPQEAVPKRPPLPSKTMR